jgi:hypothetical protein
MLSFFKKIDPNILVFLLFLSFFFIQRIFFNLIQDTTIDFAGSLIYLPHGIRVLATLVGGRKIIPGLLLGHIASGLYAHSFLANTNIEFANILNLETSIINLLTSIGSSFCVLLALFILNINYDYIKSITLKTIFLVSIISSVINSFFTNTIYFISYENWEIGTQFFQYILGDLIGALIIFYILKFSKKMLKSFIG